MNPIIEATKADHIPPDAHVCHYDELIGEAKHALPDAVTNGAATVPWRTAEEFATIDVVKFTSYYRVTVTERRETSESSRAAASETRSRSEPLPPGREPRDANTETWDATTDTVDTSNEPLLE